MLLVLIEKAAVIVPLAKETESQWDDFLGVAEVETVIDFLNGGEWMRHTGTKATHPLIQDLRQRRKPGLVLFSSGSSGAPKAAIHDFSRLLSKFRVQRHSYVTLTMLLWDHVGGQNTALYVISNCGCLVPIQNRSDPDTVCDAIERYQVELLPTSPTFLNMLLVSGAYTRFCLSSLKVISYGTEVMPESTLRRLREVLPDVRLLQTYGLSELGILRSKSRDSGSLWVKVGGEDYQTEVRDGTLWIKAKSAMLGYLNAPSPFDADGWMNTGDAVEVDGEWLRILGRKSEIINVGGLKVHPVEVESVIEEMPGVESAVVYGEAHPLTGHVVCTTVKLKPGELWAASQVKLFCRERLERYKCPVKVVFTDDALYSARIKKRRVVNEE
jgi:acyl-CoA synthetase (AMP-forming)/AMP-acid ligase II